MILGICKYMKQENWEELLKIDMFASEFWLPNKPVIAFLVPVQLSVDIQEEHVPLWSFLEAKIIKFWTVVRLKNIINIVFSTLRIPQR